MYLRPALFLLFCCLPAFAAPQPVSRETQIQSRKTLNVCIWPDYYGISYRNPKNRQLTGIDIDLAHEFARDLGNVAVRFIDSSFVHLVEDLKSNRCDIGMFAIGITPARMAHLHFTRPYLHSDIYAITTKSNRRIRHWTDIDQPGVVVAVHKGTYHEQVMREKLQHATLLVAETPFAREQEVESGRADVFMTDFPYAQRMLKTASWARRISPGKTFHITAYAYAVLPGDEHWRARADRFVENIKRDGRLLVAARRHGLESIVNTD